jgi:CDP-glucose 4,6-dehydratase
VENLGVTVNAIIDISFWKGKRVFLTGHTGFKGCWLSLWLNHMGAIVKGFSLEPPTQPSLFNVANLHNTMDSETGDIRNLEVLTKSITEFNPDILIHMAAQSLVRFSYVDPITTYSTNVMGTLNVLEAARKCKNLRAIVNITTDKCYENREWEWGYRENEPMGGHDPYSNSKGCAELITAAYRNSFFNTAEKPALASARAGNVIGGGDWAQDRLIPDILRAFEKNQSVIIRNPQATRPWQHVLEPLSGYLVLAQSLYQNGHAFAEGWNFGPKDEDVEPVEWILNKMVSTWGQGASWRLDSGVHPHEAKYLKLDISKARTHLHWSPTWSLENTLHKIVLWHRAWLANEDMHAYSIHEIKSYMAAMNSSC